MLRTNFSKKIKLFFFGTETAVFTDVPKTSTKERIYFSQFSKKWKTLFLRKNLLRCFFWRHRKQFCQRCEKLGKTPKVLPRKSYFFFKNVWKSWFIEHYTKAFFDKSLHKAGKKQFWWNCFNILLDCIKVFTQ